MSHNIVCASCAILGHHIDEFTFVSPTYDLLASLAVQPNLVPFSFECGIPALDDHHIMIDPLAIIENGNKISICNKCHEDLCSHFCPADTLANFHWIGPIPGELQDLTWAEEALIA